MSPIFIYQRRENTTMNKSTTKLAPRTMEEQETTIVFDRAGDTMRIYTADTTMITLLDKKVSTGKGIHRQGRPVCC